MVISGTWSHLTGKQMSVVQNVMRDVFCNDCIDVARVRFPRLQM
jgi:hypothetical protein